MRYGRQYNMLQHSFEVRNEIKFVAYLHADSIGILHLRSISTMYWHNSYMEGPRMWQNKVTQPFPST